MEYLNDFQKDIISECMKKQSGGLSLPMGSGKTLISLVLSLKQTKNDDRNPSLYITSKTLIKECEHEIKKFFGETLNYIIYHQDYTDIYIENFGDDVPNIVITTPDTLAKIYTEYGIEDLFQFEDHRYDDQLRRNVLYKTMILPNAPLNKHTLFYSTHWNCVIIDEIQNYTNINTLKCKAIAATFSDYRWGLSGTIINEPKPERILGYHMMIHDRDFPTNLPGAKMYLRQNYPGIMTTLVHRDINIAYKEPKLNIQIIEHTLSPKETTVYLMMKDIINEINRWCQIHQAQKNVVMARKFSSSILAMIMYLRQTIICPLIPLTSAIIDTYSLGTDSIISRFLQEQLVKHNLNSYLDNVNSVVSSRIKKVIEVTKKHKKCIIFSTFRTFIDLLSSLIKDKKLYIMDSKMSANIRNKLIEDFKNNNGDSILLTTYHLGSEGLNLQFCDTILLVDFWWNSGITKQAMARINRYGQKAEELNIYLFTANTAIEQVILKKQDDKQKIIDELFIGTSAKKIKTIKVDDIIKMINQGDNYTQLAELYT